MGGYKQQLASYPFSLRGRLLFLICLASMPAILFTFFAAGKERAMALNRIKREGLQFAAMASREHSHQISGARELLAWLGARVAREGPRSPVLTDPDFLRALLAGHPQLANIGALSLAGDVISSAYPLSNYHSWKDNPAYRAALASDGVEAGSYIISPIFERPTLNHAYAVRDARKRPITVLFNGLNLDWIAKMTRNARLTEGFSVFIVDRGGRVLASAASDAAGSASAVAGFASFPGIVEIAQSHSGVVLPRDSANSQRFVVAAPLEKTPGLFVAAAVPYDKVVGAVNAAFFRTIISLGVLTFFTIVSVFIATELGMLRGIRALSRAAQRFGDGDLSARVTVPHGCDEFTSLAGAFNTMADSLADRHAEALDAQRRLRALANRLQSAREEEAARIARELHDEMAQALTALKIDLSRQGACCPDDRRNDPCSHVLRQAVTETTGRIAAMVDLVRRISSELRPSVLDKLGLTAALQWQAGEIEARTELAVQVEADDDNPILDARVSLALFRIAQEALVNVVRHAQADLVEISLVTRGKEISLTVRDNGKGIAAEEVDSTESLGIIGMRERAMLVGGRVSMHGYPRQGTTVTVVVPASIRGGDEYPVG